MREMVFRHMVRTRGWKYKAFLRYLRLFKYFAFAPVRGAFLESYYTLMRYLDDIVDGDAPLPEGFLDGSEYLRQKILFSKELRNPQDPVDYLMLHCFDLGDRFGAQFQSETEDILNSLLFDARRRGRLEIFSKHELAHHFHVLDIRGTIRATLKVFKEDPDKYLLLEPLGMASRYQFDLEDLETDLEAGYVNISKEECAHFHIEPTDFTNTQAESIQKWKRHRAQEGLNLLGKHHSLVSKGNFSMLARATFPLVYEYPAKKVFREVLAQTSWLQERQRKIYVQS